MKKQSKQNNSALKDFCIHINEPLKMSYYVTAEGTFQCVRFWAGSVILSYSYDFDVITKIVVNEKRGRKWMQEPEEELERCLSH